ncbi:DUF393 domain-containing protein [Thalassotalea sp. LPB0316]|uniref:thiol-disulfide oxidoreductase DCC family protein n=1 Tax=Thalassotalea sp. LPB0316 TaxID=2769490 RepID=UPI00186790A7|nr:DUF393 domain-containing protein [Thalassotalea sp. LPB0316]QOL25131.1 DUF393 domain-containing protein [Thalassotalea sp. LPB0316]
MTKLLIFYDGHCPLCCYEMTKLCQYDNDKLIALVDIHADEFNQYANLLDKNTALARIHAIYQGDLIQGIDVNYYAWQIAGKPHYVWPLKVPVLRQIAQIGYLLFAHFRRPISKLANKLFKLEQANCHQGVCYDKQSTTDHRRK